MNLLKTMFYPVCMTSKTIYIAPAHRRGSVSLKWCAQDAPCVGIRGSEILADKSFAGFKRVPTVTRESVLAEWKEDAARSLYLWESAARYIVATIEGNDPKVALEKLKAQLRSTRAMAISASYMRAVSDVKTVIAHQVQAS